MNRADEYLVVLNGCRTVPLSEGDTTLIDECDLPIAQKLRWQTAWNRISNTFYASNSNKRRTPRTVKLHRLIMDAPEGIQVDHKNMDGLDNRRENLRLATQTQQNANKNPQRGRKFKGAYLDKRRGNFMAAIGFNNRFIHIGMFATEEEAARAYDREAIKLFGEFARLNFPVTEAAK